MLVLQGIVSKFNTMVDGSGRIQIDTPELSPEEFMEIGKVNKKSGVMVFKPDATKFSKKELDAIKSFETPGLGDHKPKTKSQSLRAVIFLMWQADPEGFDKSEDHYDFYMDKLITFCKGKLPKKE